MNGGKRISTDDLYARKRAEVEDFKFDATVTEVFDDMVRRSVPGYDLIVEMIGVLASAHADAIGRPLNCVDLGCSRGAVSKVLTKTLSHPDTRFTLVDAAPAMIDAARTEIRDNRATFSVGDAREATLEHVDFAVMNLVLQFIPPPERTMLLRRIRDGLRPDGVFILTEKIEADQEFVDYHLAFKRAKGYSELEIKQKRDALENVMVIDSLATHKSRLREAGFSSVSVWFRLLNWVSILARP